MVYVYKLPQSLDPNALRQYIGTMGTMINPVLDANGNWIVSTEVWESQEFEYLKISFPEVTEQFEKIEWKAPTTL